MFRAVRRFTDLCNPNICKFKLQIQRATSSAVSSRQPAPCLLKSPVVNSHNEWDPLEEVIVGTVRGAHVPPFEFYVKAAAPPSKYEQLEREAAKPFAPELVKKAEKELNYFCHVLEQEGVIVKRPEVKGEEGKEEIGKPFKTPDFESPCGMYAAMPRDNLLVIGDTILEAPMSWRCRFFEYRHYRKLIKDYFSVGAKWIQAPKPTMSDSFYNFEWKNERAEILKRCSQNDNIDYDFSITNSDPMFEAADFARFGRDIFYQLSHATNEFGVEWMKRTFPDHRFHRVSMRNDEQAFHIDATFVPLGPGKLLIEAERPPDCGGVNGIGGWFEFDGKPTRYSLPTMFKGWDVFVAPKPHFPEPHPYFSSTWVASSNILMLDPERVFVEAEEHEVIRCFKRWGFKPIPIPLRNTMIFGGGFHCITCDVRRRGTLQSYF